MKNIFINLYEKRLRAGWRVLITTLLIAGLTFGAYLSGVFDHGPLPLARMEFSFMLMALAVIGLAGRFLDKRRFADFGLQPGRRTWWLELGFGVVLGLLEAAVLILILSLLGWVKISALFETIQNTLPLGLALVVDLLTFASVGIMEELIRAYQMRNLAEGLAGASHQRWRLALWAGAVGASLFSALMHMNQQGPVFWAYVFLNSLIYCLMYLWTGRIAIAIGAHLAWDFFITTVTALGGAASGLNAAVLYDAPLLPAGDAPQGQLMITFIGFGLKILGTLLVITFLKRRNQGQPPRLQQTLSIYQPQDVSMEK